MALTIPGGRKKHTPLTQADTKDIEYWFDRITGDLQSNPQKQFADKDREWLVGAKAELDRRAAGGQKEKAAPQAGSPSTALANRPQGSTASIIAGAWHNAKDVDVELRKASETMHLVSPATVCGALPEGCEVALAVVYVNPDSGKNGPGEVFEVGGGKLALSGVTLKRIGAAAGVDWDLERSGRLDNGRDPCYCHYRAVGYVQNFDGSIRTISGEVEIDAREGSPQLDEIRQKATAREADSDYRGKRDGGASQILELRKFLLRHAESKAKNRAIADMGIKRSYNKDELSKPFAVARLMATGRSNDPALREKFALMKFDKMTSGRSALYGPPRAPALPVRASVPFDGHDPPPPGAVEGDPEDFGGRDYEDDDNDEYDTHGEDVTNQAQPSTMDAGQRPSVSTSARY